MRHMQAFPLVAVVSAVVATGLGACAPAATSALTPSDTRPVSVVAAQATSTDTALNVAPASSTALSYSAVVAGMQIAQRAEAQALAAMQASDKVEAEKAAADAAAAAEAQATAAPAAPATPVVPAAPAAPATPVVPAAPAPDAGPQNTAEYRAAAEAFLKTLPGGDSVTVDWGNPQGHLGGVWMPGSETIILNASRLDMQLGRTEDVLRHEIGHIHQNRTMANNNISMSDYEARMDQLFGSNGTEKAADAVAIVLGAQSVYYQSDFSPAQLDAARTILADQLP